MAVLRIQSIKVSDLGKAVAHRRNPDVSTPYEELVGVRYFIDEKNIGEYLFQNIGVNPDRIKILNEIYKEEGDVRFFEAIESVMFSRKIRKNSTVQELVIAYDSDESKEVAINPMKETSYDVADFFEAFKEVCGFKPFYVRYVHRDKETGRYHVHILFSLVHPVNGKKVKWNQKIYFKVLNKAAKLSNTLRIQSQKSKTIGKYPLWMFQRLVEIVNDKELASLITSICRRVELPTENYYQLILNLQGEWQNILDLYDHDLDKIKNLSEETLISKVILPCLKLPEGNPVLEKVIEYQRELREEEILKKPSWSPSRREDNSPGISP